LELGLNGSFSIRYEYEKPDSPHQIGQAGVGLTDRTFAATGGRKPAICCIGPGG
jgi:hypothetical protein